MHTEFRILSRLISSSNIFPSHKGNFTGCMVLRFGCAVQIGVLFFIRKFGPLWCMCEDIELRSVVFLGYILARVG